MTNAEIKTEIASLVDDTGIDSTSLQLWVNSGYGVVTNALIALNQGFYQTTEDIAIIAGTANYALPTGHIKTTRIEDSGGVSVPKVLLDSGRAGWYFHGAYIRITPEPTTSGSYLHYYVEKPDNLSADSDVPAFNAGYHELLVLYGQTKYYDSDQEEGEASYYLNKFNALLEEFIENQQRTDEELRIEEKDPIIYDETVTIS